MISDESQFDKPRSRPMETCSRSTPQVILRWQILPNSLQAGMLATYLIVPNEHGSSRRLGLPKRREKRDRCASGVAGGGVRMTSRRICVGIKSGKVRLRIKSGKMRLRIKSGKVRLRKSGKIRLRIKPGAWQG